ncbi:DJ-1/PfpI/YhbO family deglycase/protease [Candidatus Bathyarchaeota archaeon]|nr:DJ-1/PfpI/YhbO family deglycase/protease [Candidatus Bathyarchaeota archaeon]
MSKAIILVENGFEDIELLYPYYRLMEAGYTVDIVGPKSDETYKGKKGGSIKSTKSPEETSIEEYSVLVVPGGWAPDRLRTKENMVNLVQEADEKGLVIAAICHAAQLLVEADIVDGRNLTSYASVSTDVKNAGGNYHDKSLVVDGNLVTSRYPADIPEWMPAVIEQAENK